MLPRVLVVAPVPFNLHAGGGVTMGNLFRGWPTDALAQIHSSSSAELDTSVCRHYFCLAAAPPWLGDGPPPGRRALLRLAVAALGPRAALPSLDDEAIEWARRFDPEVIYARPLDRPAPFWWLPAQISAALCIPYVLHIMDDWTARPSARGPGSLPTLRRLLMLRCLRHLVRGAAARFAISPQMGAAFQRRWGLPFESFSNCVDMARWKAPSHHRGGSLDLVYVGALTEDKELASVEDVALAVRRLHDAGHAVTFRIYTAPKWQPIAAERLAAPPAVVAAGFVPSEQLPETLASAGALVLAINFDPGSLAYIGDSLQNKVPEYMASGAPILVYGPPASANVTYAREAGWGLVVDQRDPDALAEAILALLRDRELAERLSSHARAVVARNHDCTTVRARFRSRLREAAEGDGPRTRSSRPGSHVGS